MRTWWLVVVAALGLAFMSAPVMADEREGDREGHVARDREEGERHHPERERGDDREEGEREVRRDRERPEGKRRDRDRPEGERRDRPRPEAREGERRDRPEGADVERVLHALREMGHGERAEQLRGLRQRQPDRFHAEMREAGEFVRHMREMRERDPEGFELHQRAARMERESHRMAEAVRRTEGDRREAAVRELRQHLNTLFDLKLRIRAREVERLERELKRLTERLDARRKAKEQIVDQRLRQLTGTQTEWEW